MPQTTDAHYTLSLMNHQTGQKLQLEMVDLPFPSRSYRLKVNGQWAKKGCEQDGSYATAARLVGRTLRESPLRFRSTNGALLRQHIEQSPRRTRSRRISAQFSVHTETL